MSEQTILVLANSLKVNGRCIAGLEIDPMTSAPRVGKWFRPVAPAGESKEGELRPPRHCAFEDGYMPEVLDIVEVPVGRQCSDPGQPENWEVRSGARWRWLDSFDAADLPCLVETPEGLWVDGDCKSDRITPESQLRVPDSPSLVLIQPEGFRITKRAEYAGKIKTRAVFSYRGIEYALSITDDVFKEEHCQEPDASTGMIESPFGDECLLCVSLGAPYNGHHYKLVATVIDTR